MDVLPICMSEWMFCLNVCLTPCAHCAQRGQKSIRNSGTGVTGGREVPCECWELNRNV